MVVWADSRDLAETDYDIYGYDLSTGQEFPVCLAPGTQAHPAVHAGVVVWEDHRRGSWDIYGYDLSNGQEFPICVAPGSQLNPSIYGSIVVWYDDRNGGATDIYGSDISTGKEFPICTAQGRQRLVTLFNNTVVWEDERNEGKLGGDIYSADLLQTSVFEESDPRVTYWRAWRTYADARCSGGELKYASKRWASADFLFTGTGVAWRASKAKMMGKAYVYLDDVPLGLVDLYGQDPVFQQIVWQRTGLAPGLHRLSMLVSGKKNPMASDIYVNLDAVEVVP